MKNKFRPKVISSIMIGSMLACNTVPAYATYWEVEGEEALSGTEITATVTYNPSVSFMVSVPKNIALNPKTKLADYHITVKGEIEKGTEVVVAPKDSITNIDGINFYMSDKSAYNKSDVVATVTQESTEWFASEVTKNGTVKKGTISAQGLSYGDWSGNLVFMVNLCEDHEHNYENGICTECGKTDPNHEHSYTEAITKEPTCTEAGEKTLTCYCGDSKTESIPPTGHNFENGSCTECGEADTSHIHNYTETITKEPTCTEDGEKTLTCDCGNSIIESIPATGHVDENNDLVCDTCNTIMEGHIHSYGEWFVRKQPTCSEDGLQEHKCTTCGNVETESIPASDDMHEYDSDGYCSKCGEYEVAPYGALDNWEYTLDGYTVRLTKYKGTEENVTVYAKYIDDTGAVCNTQIYVPDANSSHLFRYNTSVKTVKFNKGIDCSNLKSMVSWFQGCTALTSADLSNLDASNVILMSYMFEDCSSLISVNVSSLNTPSLIGINYMCRNCTSLGTLNLRSFSLKSGGQIAGAFYNCPSLRAVYVTANKWSKNTTGVVTFQGSGCSSFTYL